MRLKALFARAAVVAVALVATVTAATPAHASGGGCAPDSTQNGWRVGVCSGDDGVYMYPDFYINARPAVISNCTAQLRVLITGHGTSNWAYYTCSLGRKAGVAFNMRNFPVGTQFRTHVQIWNSGVRQFDGVGPITRCC